MLLGEYNYNVDAKGRVFVPAKLRDDLGEKFVIAKSLDTCLALYPMDKWEEYVDRLAGIPEMKARSIRRFVFSTATEAEADSQGRVVLSQPLREYAGLDKEVTIIGVNNHAEIWDAQSYQNYMAGESREQMVEILTEYDF